MQKYKYTYEEFSKDSEKLALKCRTFNPDTLLAVARGGMTLTHFMAHLLDIRNIAVLNSIYYNDTFLLNEVSIFNIPQLEKSKKVLIIDDIIDSGNTMEAILKIFNLKFPTIEFKTATLFYKKTASLQPDYSVQEATQWIDFFWEVLVP